MAYKKEDMIKKCLKVIKEKRITRIQHIIGFVPFNRATFYNHGLDKLDSIKNAIENQKIFAKVDLINDWKKSKSPALQIAAYRLLADEDEFERLVMNQIDHTSKGDKIQPLNVNVVKDENAEKYKKHLDKLAQLN